MASNRGDMKSTTSNKNFANTSEYNIIKKLLLENSSREGTLNIQALKENLLAVNNLLEIEDREFKDDVNNLIIEKSIDFRSLDELVEKIEQKLEIPSKAKKVFKEAMKQRIDQDDGKSFVLELYDQLQKQLDPSNERNIHIKINLPVFRSNLNSEAQAEHKDSKQNPISFVFREKKINTSELSGSSDAEAPDDIFEFTSSDINLVDLVHQSHERFLELNELAGADSSDLPSRNTAIQITAKSEFQKKKKRKKKKKAVQQPFDANSFLNENLRILEQMRSKKINGITKEDLWSSDRELEQKQITEYWLGLNKKERQILVNQERKSIISQIYSKQSAMCSCCICQRKKVGIEEELGGLYEQYYWQLEQEVQREHKRRNVQESELYARAKLVKSLSSITKATRINNDSHFTSKDDLHTERAINTSFDKVNDYNSILQLVSEQELMTPESLEGLSAVYDYIIKSYSTQGSPQDQESGIYRVDGSNQLGIADIAASIEEASKAIKLWIKKATDYRNAYGCDPISISNDFPETESSFNIFGIDTSQNINYESVREHGIKMIELIEQLVENQIKHDSNMDEGSIDDDFKSNHESTFVSNDSAHDIQSSSGPDYDDEKQNSESEHLVGAANNTIAGHGLDMQSTAVLPEMSASDYFSNAKQSENNNSYSTKYRFVDEITDNLGIVGLDSLKLDAPNINNLAGLNRINKTESSSYIVETPHENGQNEFYGNPTNKNLSEQNYELERERASPQYIEKQNGINSDSDSDSDSDDETVDEVEISRKIRQLFHTFAARMLELRVVKIFKERKAEWRRLELERELERENMLTSQRNMENQMKKQKKREKEKKKRQQQKLLKKNRESEAVEKELLVHQHTSSKCKPKNGDKSKKSGGSNKNANQSKQSQRSIGFNITDNNRNQINESSDISCLTKGVEKLNANFSKSKRDEISISEESKKYTGKSAKNTPKSKDLDIAIDSSSASKLKRYLVKSNANLFSEVACENISDSMDSQLRKQTSSDGIQNTSCSALESTNILVKENVNLDQKLTLPDAEIYSHQPVLPATLETNSLQASSSKIHSDTLDNLKLPNERLIPEASEKPLTGNSEKDEAEPRAVFEYSPASDILLLPPNQPQQAYEFDISTNMQFLSATEIPQGKIEHTSFQNIHETSNLPIKGDNVLNITDSKLQLGISKEPLLVSLASITDPGSLYMPIKSAYLALQNMRLLNPQIQTQLSNDNTNATSSNSFTRNNNLDSYSPICAGHKDFQFECASDVLKTFKQMYNDIRIENERQLLDICSYAALNNLDIFGSFVIDLSLDKLKYYHSERYYSECNSSFYHHNNINLFKTFDTNAFNYIPTYIKASPHDVTQSNNTHTSNEFSENYFSQDFYKSSLSDFEPPLYPSQMRHLFPQNQLMNHNLNTSGLSGKDYTDPPFYNQFLKPSPLSSLKNNPLSNAPIESHINFNSNLAQMPGVLNPPSDSLTKINNSQFIGLNQNTDQNFIASQPNLLLFTRQNNLGFKTGGINVSLLSDPIDEPVSFLHNERLLEQNKTLQNMYQNSRNFSYGPIGSLSHQEYDSGFN